MNSYHRPEQYNFQGVENQQADDNYARRSREPATCKRPEPARENSGMPQEKRVYAREDWANGRVCGLRSDKEVETSENHEIILPDNLFNSPKVEDKDVQKFHQNGN